MGHPPYGRTPRGDTNRGLAAVMTLVAGVLLGAVVAVTTALGPPPASKDTSTPQDSGHSETAVRQAAQLALDTYSSGAHGDFWDLWSRRAQALIRREDYTGLLLLCPPAVRDTPFTVTTVTITGDDAVVWATRAGETDEFDFRHEDGSWRYTPSPEQQREYQGRTAGQIVQERRASGACAPPSAVEMTGPHLFAG